MNTLDIIILIVIGAGTVLGFTKGFLKQLVSLTGLVAGLLAARALYVPLAEKLCPAVTESMSVAQAISFVAIWIAVPLGFSFIASLLTRTLEAVSLGWINHLLGAVLGALKFTLLVGLLISVIDFIDMDSHFLNGTKKQESVLYYPVKSFAGLFFPAIKNVAQQYIR